METKEYKTVDKSSWGDGPWQNEPDKVQYADPDTGMACLIVRNHGGALCGYVGVPEGHPWFGKGYDDVDAEVHGGLTFAGLCQTGPGATEEQHICHVPAPGEPDRVWWLGYDCGHAFDLMPAMEARYRGSDLEMPRSVLDSHVYRDIAYVKDQNAQLAKQAVDAK